MNVWEEPRQRVHTTALLAQELIVTVGALLHTITALSAGDTLSRLSAQKVSLSTA